MAVYIVIGRAAKNHNRKQTVIGLLFSLYKKLYAKLYYLTDGVIYYVKRKAEQPVHAGI